jgi:hypothetical protein
MDYYGNPFPLLPQILFALLYIGCAIVVLTRWGGCGATGLLCGGFGALLLAEILLMSLQYGYFRIPYELFRVMPFLRVVGYILILVGLILAPVRGSASTSSAPVASTGVALPPSSYRPGWGLVSAWIVLSSLGFIGGIVTLLVFLEAGRSVSNSEMEVIMIVAGITMLFVIPTVIIYMIWLYQCWDSIPEQYRSASPGQAVGFLFIPFFNLYWIFRAVPGLSASIGRAMQAHDPKNVGAPSFGMGVTACVLALIPYVNMISWPFFLTWVCQANAARNRMLLAANTPPAK